MTTAGDHSLCNKSAEIIVVRATTEPTERSIPPERITKVIPTAAIPKNALSIKRLINTCNEKKLGYAKEPAAYIRRKRPNVMKKGRVFLFINNNSFSGKQGVPF
jgi:hypothetical protein